MWVHPKWRGSINSFGSKLLEEGKRFCLAKGDQFMLLVHDDNGTGKLIDYYKNIHDFYLIENDIGLPKAMVCKL